MSESGRAWQNLGGMKGRQSAPGWTPRRETRRDERFRPSANQLRAVDGEACDAGITRLHSPAKYLAMAASCSSVTVFIRADMPGSLDRLPLREVRHRPDEIVVLLAC